MNRLGRLLWTLFDREVADGIDVGFGTAVMISYPRLWKIGVRRRPCGCAFRVTGKQVLYCTSHAFDEDDETEESNA